MATETQKSCNICAQDKNPLPPTKPRAKPGPSTFADVLQMLRRDHYLHGEEASIDELLDPSIEQEDLDSEFLHFADGDEGTREILEYLKLRDKEEQDEEDPQEPEEMEEAKVQTSITSFWK
ncbi:hypothetical protein K438DRAFT_1777783 [Mycena galopus ATCC 62051]|nr:hypothetical protein K438DRAFT_1777783 [Mycena galopus ATCC 62051]